MSGKLTLMLLLTVVAVIGVSGASAATFNISGFKVNNATGEGIPGWNITLTNSTMQTTTTTDVNGFYEFTDLLNGTYNVSEEMKPGFTPVGDTFKIITIENMDVMDVNFTNQPVAPSVNGSIIGTKFNDLNGNGIRDANEPGIANVTITLNGFDKLDREVVKETTVTDANGNYSFTNLTPGNYIVREKLPPKSIPTTPPARLVRLIAGQIAVVDFGNRMK